MAKYGRFDPRNKKQGKHKSQSLEKDLRIREVEDFNDRNYSRILREVTYDNGYDNESFYQEHKIV